MAPSTPAPDSIKKFLSENPNVRYTDLYDAKASLEAVLEHPAAVRIAKSSVTFVGEVSIGGETSADQIWLHEVHAPNDNESICLFILEERSNIGFGLYKIDDEKLSHITPAAIYSTYPFDAGLLVERLEEMIVFLEAHPKS